MTVDQKKKGELTVGHDCCTSMLIINVDYWDDGSAVTITVENLPKNLSLRIFF